MVGELLRTLAPPVLAMVSAILIDSICWRRGLRPPGFSRVDDEAPGLSVVRRAGAMTVIGFVLWLGVFAPLGLVGSGADFDPSAISTPQLFLLHGLLIVAATIWYLLGFGFDASRWIREFGVYAKKPLFEIALGVTAGVAAWLSVILVMVLTGLGVWALGGRDLLPESAPALVPWLAGLPLALRIAVSCSAGIAEEFFFRGFLQPRVGVALSSGLFVLAHLSYEQPFMLLGVLLLSLIFAALVRWRQSIWAAVVAHATFDVIQLTIMIPWALKNLESDALPVLGALM